MWVMLTMVRDVGIYVNFMVLGLRKKVCVKQLQVKAKVVPQQVNFLGNVANYKQNVQYTIQLGYVFLFLQILVLTGQITTLRKTLNPTKHLSMSFTNTEGKI